MDHLVKGCEDNLKLKKMLFQFMEKTLHTKYLIFSVFQFIPISFQSKSHYQLVAIMIAFIVVVLCIWIGSRLVDSTARSELRDCWKKGQQFMFKSKKIRFVKLKYISLKVLELLKKQK